MELSVIRLISLPPEFVNSYNNYFFLEKKDLVDLVIREKGGRTSSQGRDSARASSQPQSSTNRATRYLFIVCWISKLNIVLKY